MLNFQQILKDRRLQLWPGYVTSIRQHEVDTLLCAEITTKVMRDETVLEMFERGNNLVEIANNLVGSIVLTDYNNKTYRIDDVTFKMNPRNTFLWRGEATSYIDYYYQKYRITIRDERQPLLISRSSDRDIRAGMTELIVLLPELCRPTGLTEQERKNFW